MTDAGNVPEVVVDEKPAPPDPPVIIDRHRPCKEYQYAAKLVSGLLESTDGPLAPGRYYTAVNIHNPSTCRTITFRWKVTRAQSVTPPIKPLITGWSKVTVRPDESVEIDRQDITFAMHFDGFVKGFVVVESPCELDVVSVYSATGGHQLPGQAGGSPAFHTERVPARVIDACVEDLDVDISTGVVEWMVTSAVDLGGINSLANIVTPRPANVMENQDISPGWSKPTGPCAHARWIGTRGIGHNLDPNVAGYYTFQYCFCLCSGFEKVPDKPFIDISFFVDDLATIWMNDQLVFPQGGSFSGTPTTVALNDRRLFLPGLNCLSFVVKNVAFQGDNPVGLNVCARLRALRGSCPSCGCCADCGPTHA